jgi:hypothetical protein
MAKKGWPQSLDNGVMNLPNVPEPGSRQSTQARMGKNMDFYSMIAGGENEHGQTTISPAMVTRAGKTVYDQEDYPNTQKGDRWKPKKR